MSATDLSQSSSSSGNLERASLTLKITSRLWFILALIGQWLFATYVLAFYGGSAITGQLELWSTFLSHGWRSEAIFASLLVALHLLLAAFIMYFGPLQFIPSIRKNCPGFHKMVGRFYVLSAFPAAIGGMYMVWVHGTVGDLSQHLSVTTNGVLIIVFAVLAWRTAIKRDFKSHMRWAFRLFLAMSGVWFFRVGMMFWLLVHQEPVGFDPETFTGPFLSVLSVLVYIVLPLSVLQLYFWAKGAKQVVPKYIASAVLLTSCVVTAIGVFGATVALWIPQIKALG
jgi:hypothetical protein